MIGCCFPHELCDLHRDGLFQQLKGTAATRGEVWADDVARDRPFLVGEPWPRGSDKVIAIARTKVNDLARDPRLLEMLAAELATWAERRWRAMNVPAAVATR